jgi:hypothetical protein
VTTSPIPRTTVRAALSRRFATSREYAALVRELSEYWSPRDRAELDAMLSRHTEQEGAQINAVLTALAQQDKAPGGGHVSRRRADL